MTAYEDEETISEDEPEQESKNAIPWITAFDAFTKFGKPAPILKALVKAKKLRTKKMNGKEVYSVEDLKKLDDEEGEGTQETSMADLVNSARSMMGTLQTHHEKMFDKYMTAFDKVQQTLLETIDKGNKHVIALEEQAADMREATEKVFNLEHTRRMEELKEERTREMQSKALKTLQEIFGPLIMQKLGGKLPGFPAGPTGETDVEGGADPRLSQLGGAVINMVVAMSDEQFAKMADVIPEVEFMVLSTIRMEARKS